MIVPIVIVLVLSALVASLVWNGFQQRPRAHWPLSGKDVSHTRHQDNEQKVSTANVAGLEPRWVFQAGGDVSATPTVDEQSVYFTDWAGGIYRLDADTGAVRWARKVEDYTGIPGSISRSSPVLDGRRLIFGDVSGPGAHVVAVDREDARLLWLAEADPHPMARVTQSPIVFRGRVYVGVSSNEAAAATDPAYPCCSFRGSVVALDAETGMVVWRTYMSAPGYWGAAVWGGTPTVDAERRLVFVTTGNNYSVPGAAAQCVRERPLSDALACLPDDNYFDSVVALDLDTGAVRWATRVQSYDSFNLACGAPGSTDEGNCPSPTGPDYDLGAGSNLFTATVGGRAQDLVGAGQKSGIYWALDRASGRVVWRTQVGPGSPEGGIMWGSAFDGKYLYTANANARRADHALVPSGKHTQTGSWSALDPATGRIVWQTAAPEDNQIPGPLAWTPGPVTVANGVLYAGSMQGNGPMYAMDASDGRILWTFASGGSVNSGPAVANGIVYWGSGYTRFGFGTPNDKLYAFAVGP